MDYINREAAKDANGESSSTGFSKNPVDPEQIARTIVDSAIEVHRCLGPGLLESAYQMCLCYELQSRGSKVEREIPVLLQYKGCEIPIGYRIDVCVDDVIIIENKTVDRLEPVHQAQLITYLKLTSRTLGFLINWNVAFLKDGLRRVVLNHRTLPLKFDREASEKKKPFAALRLRG